MSTDRPRATPAPSSPAWPALLRAELARLGLSPDAVAAALAELASVDRAADPRAALAIMDAVKDTPGVGQGLVPCRPVGAARTDEPENRRSSTVEPAPAMAQQAAPAHSALSTQHSLRWGRHTLALGPRTLIMGVINVTDDSLSGD